MTTRVAVLLCDGRSGWLSDDDACQWVFHMVPLPKTRHTHLPWASHLIRSIYKPATPARVMVDAFERDARSGNYTIATFPIPGRIKHDYDER